MTNDGYLDAARCPAERPSLESMDKRTQTLHGNVDDNARRFGQNFLTTEGPSLQVDMLGSAAVIAWQEAKGDSVFSHDSCWSGLAHLYGRYGSGRSRELMERVAQLENAKAALVLDCGMQATTCAFDALLSPGDHAICLGEVYNKTSKYLLYLQDRMGCEVSFVPGGGLSELEETIRPTTRMVFAETFTNPRLRAVDLVLLPTLIATKRREYNSQLILVIDSTIATPWGVSRPLLEQGVDVVVASGTKALGGHDRDMWGYIASNNIEFANAAMELVAMRGGVLDWRRAQAIVAGWDETRALHQARCDGAVRVAAFLDAHPAVAEVNHPSLPNHPDAAVLSRDYKLSGSLLSLRLANCDEKQARHFCDVLATTQVFRYALSFDGLVSKVNHHQTVSEYFTPPAALKKSGLDRLVRLAIGTEHPDDLCAALNWALHNHAGITAGDIADWSSRRQQELIEGRPKERR